MATLNIDDRNWTETSVTFDWTCDEVVHVLYYSCTLHSDQSATETWVQVGVQDKQAGSFTIKNLAPATTYEVRVRGDLPGGTSVYSSYRLFDTYDWPKCDSMPDFKIGKSVRVHVWNPLEREITVEFADASAATLGTQTGTGMFYTFTPDADTLYATIPNEQRGEYRITVRYAGHNQVRYGGYYNVVASECGAAISDLAHADANASIVTITGDNQITVAGKSTLTISATVTARKSATIARVMFAKVNNSGAYTDMTHNSLGKRPEHRRQLHVVRPRL